MVWNRWFVDKTKTDITSQVQILYGLKNVVSSAEKFQVGIEWHYYDYNYESVQRNSNAIQAMIKYNF